MTANLSSFLRFRFKGGQGQPPNEEQDLRGFDKAKETVDKSYMHTITESHDDEQHSEGDHSLQQQGNST